MSKNEISTKPVLKINNVDYNKNSKNEEIIDKTLKGVLNMDLNSDKSKLKKLLTYDADNKNLNININVYQNIIDNSSSDKNDKKYIKMKSTKHKKKFQSDESLPDTKFFENEDKSKDDLVSLKSSNSSFTSKINNTKVSRKESNNDKGSSKFKKLNSKNNISFNNPTINSFISKESKENIEFNANISKDKFMSNNFTVNLQEDNKYFSKKNLFTVSKETVNNIHNSNNIHNIKNNIHDGKNINSEIKEVEDSNSMIIFDKINNRSINTPIIDDKAKIVRFNEGLKIIKNSQNSIESNNPMNMKMNYEKSEKWKKLSNIVDVMRKFKQYDITPIERTEDFDSNLEDYQKRLYPNSPLIVKQEFKYPQTELKLTKSIYDRDIIEKRIEKICKINNVNKKLDFDSSDLDVNRDESDLIRMLQNLYKRRSYIEELPSIENNENSINHCSKFNNRLIEINDKNMKEDNIDSNNNLNKFSADSNKNNGELVNDLIIHLSDPELEEMNKIGLIDKLVYYIVDSNDLSFNLIKIVLHVLEEEFRISKNSKNVSKYISDQLYHGMTFIYLACREGNIELIKYFIIEKKLDYKVVSKVSFI